MTAKRILNMRILSAIVLFILVLTVLIAFAAPAQQSGTAQPYEKSSVSSVPMPTIPSAQARLRPLLPEIGNAQRGPAARLAPAAPNSGSVSLLAVVTSESGGSGSTSIAV